MADKKPSKTNEITELARSAKITRERIEGTVDPATAEASRRRWTVGPVGIGIGIGSAALVAALLYASQNRRGK